MLVIMHDLSATSYFLGSSTLASSIARYGQEWRSFCGAGAPLLFSIRSGSTAPFFQERHPILRSRSFDRDGSKY